MYLRRIVGCLLLAGSACCAAEDAPNNTCRGSQRVVAPCFTVHGRLNYWNGAPSTRIWIVGTHRVLGLRDEDLNLPSGVKRHLHDFNDEVYADFEVCPLEKYRKGEMQMVCVQSAANIRPKRTE